MKLFVKIFVYLTIVCLAYYLVSNELLKIPKNITWIWFTISIPSLILGFFMQAYQWKRILDLKAEKISIKLGVISVGLTIFGKYLPGKILMVLGRAAYVANYSNNSIKNLTIISFYSQVLTLWIGLLIGLFFIIFVPMGSIYILLIIISFLVFTLILFSSFFNKLTVQIIKLVTKKEIEIPLISKVDFFALFPSYMLSWFFWSLGFYFLVCSVTGKPETLSLLAVFPLSATLGILAIFAPGGIGVREGIMVLMLISSGISETDSITIAAFQRLWFILGEGILFFTALILNKWKLK